MSRRRPDQGYRFRDWLLHWMRSWSDVIQIVVTLVILGAVAIYVNGCGGYEPASCEEYCETLIREKGRGAALLPVSPAEKENTDGHRPPGCDCRRVLRTSPTPAPSETP